MNYVVDDLSQIVQNKLGESKEIVLWLSAQVNCYPHIGTLTNFISAFALGKHFRDYFGLPVRIVVELLESVTGEEFYVEGHKYYKNLESAKTEEGLSIRDKYLPYFLDILNRLKKRDKIDYEIKFFYDYQRNYLVKKSLIKVIKNYDLLRYTLDPKSGEIRLRFPCPQCGLTEKHIWKTKINEVTDETLYLTSYCPYHGDYSIKIDENSTDKFDMNVPLRYLVKILYLLESNKLDNVLNIIVDGGDWSGMWPLRVYMEPLLKLGYTDVPSIIYTPTILDWSGSKLSKRMYVGNQAYREYFKEGLINYSEFYTQYGEDAFDNLYNEINSWVIEPKKFIRDYTIEYIDAVLCHEKIEII